MPYNFTTIDKKWQQYWLDHKCFAAMDPAVAGDMPKAYILDMFPYPSGSGTACRASCGLHRNRHLQPLSSHEGYNVLHPMGWDAFGLPAEQHAIKTGEHPAPIPGGTSTTFAGRSRCWASAMTGTARSIPPTPDITAGRSGSSCNCSTAISIQRKIRRMPIAQLINELEYENLVSRPTAPSI